MLKPTGRLRFVERPKTGGGVALILQQEFTTAVWDEGGDGEMYEVDTGETEWEDVPVVEEE